MTRATSVRLGPSFLTLIDEFVTTMLNHSMLNTNPFQSRTRSHTSNLLYHSSNFSSSDKLLHTFLRSSQTIFRCRFLQAWPPRDSNESSFAISYLANTLSVSLDVDALSFSNVLMILRASVPSDSVSLVFLFSNLSQTS